MCLYVEKSHVCKPIPEMSCIKILRYEGDGRWVTPYQFTTVVKGAGWFMPARPARRKVREYRKDETIEGGYLHAYVSHDVNAYPSCLTRTVYNTLPTHPLTDECYAFRGVARGVVALGGEYFNDLVCQALYLPAFDVSSKHRDAELDMQ